MINYSEKIYPTNINDQMDDIVCILTYIICTKLMIIHDAPIKTNPNFQTIILLKLQTHIIILILIMNNIKVFTV